MGLSGRSSSLSPSRGGRRTTCQCRWSESACLQPEHVADDVVKLGILRSVRDEDLRRTHAVGLAA
eukprot:5368081-Pleurochrysis_carterae.AAC.1